MLFFCPFWRAPPPSIGPQKINTINMTNISPILSTSVNHVNLLYLLEAPPPPPIGPQKTNTIERMPSGQVSGHFLSFRRDRCRWDNRLNGSAGVTKWVPFRECFLACFSAFSCPNCRYVCFGRIFSIWTFLISGFPVKNEVEMLWGPCWLTSSQIVKQQTAICNFCPSVGPTSPGLFSFLLCLFWRRLENLGFSCQELHDWVNARPWMEWMSETLDSQVNVWNRERSLPSAEKETSLHLE